MLHTVNDLIKVLNSLPDSLKEKPVYAYDSGIGECARIMGVDDTITDRVDLNLDASNQLDISNAKQLLKDNGIIPVFWSLNDIRNSSVYGMEDVVLTEDEVIEVADLLERQHDASIGINWEVIASHVEMVISKR